jgi:hypothetical protein
MSKLGQRKIPISGAGYKLARHDDGKIIHGVNIGWVEWSENGWFEHLHDEPKVGFSLMVDPHFFSHTWLTTQVTEIIEQSDNHLLFKTKNSKYELTWSNK